MKQNDIVEYILISTSFRDKFKTAHRGI